MRIKIKKLTENAVIPKYTLEGDAGLDLTATSKEYDKDGNTIYGTGLAFSIPEGHVGLLFPRSSNAKKDLRLTNSVGVLDSNYRGEVTFKFRNDNYSANEDDFKNRYIVFTKEYEVGDRVGQLIILPYPKIEFIEADDLGETNRGDGGYGSTGN